ncbi:MAG: M1 family metallopeptidase [Bacillota bacterium]|jgi:hypothetical protein
MRKHRIRLLAFSLVVLAVLLQVPTHTIHSVAPAPVPIVDYSITVSLDQSIQALHGKQTVTWTNLGTAATNEMYLHLYANAFRPGSTFLKECGGRLRGQRLKEGDYGEILLESLQSGGKDLAWSYVQPDDGNEQDRTLVLVQLPESVAPGQSVRLTMSFTVKLPTVFARMGKYGQFVMAGQWFPKVAAYEPAGIRGRTADGWNAHQYHANTEYYANFGRYQVTIIVPNTHSVAATGQLASGPKEIEGQRRQYVFIADRVHDFAWAADSSFVQRQAVIESAEQPPVTVQLYLQPEHEGLAEQYFAAARETLNRLAEWLGPYPYPVLNLVCPTAGALGAGGMEYPMLVTGWDASMQNLHSLHTVLVHEIIHQYFYGLVASNEFEEAWLDEGFTSYLEDKIMEQAFGHTVQPAVEATSVYNPEPLVLEGWKYSSDYAYQSNAYIRGKLILHELERRLGWELMREVLREYCRQYRFGHPATADFQRVLERVSGQDFDRFFADYVFGAGMQDLSIVRASTGPAGSAFSTTAWIAQPHADRLTVRLWARYADQSGEELTLTIAGREQTFSWEHEQPLVSLELDPEPYQVILDNVRINNLYAVRPTNRWAMLLSYFLHLLSQWIGW